MIRWPHLSTREACLIAFETECPQPTPADVAAWSAKFPKFAEDFRETAIAMQYLVPLDEVEIPDTLKKSDWAPGRAFEKMMKVASELGLKEPRGRI